MVENHSEHNKENGRCCHSGTDASPQHCPERKNSYIVGVIAAILACACCYIPVIALTVGLSFGRGIGFLDKYHAFIDAIGIALMVGASIYIWRQHKRADLSIFKDKHFWLPLVCMLVMYGVMSLGISQWLLQLPDESGAGHHSMN